MIMASEHRGPAHIDILAKRPEPEKLKAILREIREKIVAKQDEYDEEDVRRILEEDRFVERYLYRFDYDASGALTMMEAYLNWRKQYPGVDGKLFPTEFYQYSGIFAYEPDRNGNRTLYLRIRLNRRIDTFAWVQRLFVLSKVFESERQASKEHTGVGVIVDCTGMSFANVDMPLMYFALEIYLKYIPGLTQYFLVYNMPRFFYYLLYAAKAFVPSRFSSQIYTAYGDEIYDYVDKHNLPPFLGGECQVNHYVVPDGTTSYKDWEEFVGVKTKDLQRIYNIFEPLLQGVIEEAKTFFPHDYNSD